tara:strand:+ start:369 stop:1949 length:1581 start_codon:yes stop_codon:yes gene_type:complete
MSESSLHQYDIMALDDKFVSLALKNLQDVLARSGISPEALFTKYDFDGDGLLSYEEFSNSLSSITGQRAPRTALEAIFNAIDVDNSGGLELREIISSFGGKNSQSNIQISPGSSLEITDHANNEYNGTYFLQDNQINGQPWFKNTKNPSSPKILYFFNANSGGAPSWSLDDRLQDGSKDLYRGGWTRAIADGELPLGTRRWVGIGKVTISFSDIPDKTEKIINSEEKVGATSVNNNEIKPANDDDWYNSKTGKQQLEYLRDNNTKPSNMEELVSELDMIKDALVKGVNDNSISVKEGRIYADSVFENKLRNIPTPLKPIARSAWDSQADSIETTLLASAGIATVGASVIAANTIVEGTEDQELQVSENTANEIDIPDITLDNVENYSENSISREEVVKTSENISPGKINVTEESMEKLTNFTIDKVVEDFSKARFSQEKKAVEEKYNGEKLTLDIKVKNVQRTFGMNLQERYKGGNTLLAKYENYDLEILLPNSPEYADYSQNNEYNITTSISTWNGIRNRLVLLV